MKQVFVTQRGKVWHATRDCSWLAHAKTRDTRIGRRVHPTRQVSLERTRRKPCKVCAPAPEPETTCPCWPYGAEPWPRCGDCPLPRS